MQKLQKQLEKRGFNAELSVDGVEVYDLLEDDYILIELSEDGYIYLVSENASMQLNNNFSDILEGLHDFTN